MMLDHCNHLFSFNPSRQVSRNCDSKGDVEFNSWDENSGETELQEHFDEEFDDYSVGLWKTNTSRNFKTETDHLLPHNYSYSNISPRSRLQAISEARKELMYRIHDMPESSYELSLKDIVDDQVAPEEVHEENETERTSFHFNTTGTPVKKRKTRITGKNGKSCQISRSGSMEKETFMIKLFVPSFLSWKTEVKGGNGSKASTRSPSHGYENHADKGWGIKGFLAVDGKRSNRSNSSSSSSSSRYLVSSTVAVLSFALRKAKARDMEDASSK
ncbi:uncharacterized protein LOC8281208 isoform X1 [Ricinus communis]|uniref:uncharacterized protein LOC8281208 isoform X1 n=1 Tax=Ricinus communis TaxID=3988 RepID=UPI00201AC915|nr:uncharacterized protein LOC8281208 isoform X1 [Ricinus communis]